MVREYLLWDNLVPSESTLLLAVSELILTHLLKWHYKGQLPQLTTLMMSSVLKTFAFYPGDNWNLNN